MIVRNVRNTDNLSLISRVYIDSFIETYKDFLTQEFIDSVTQKNWLEGIQNHKDFFVMVSDKDVVGIASIRDAQEDAGEIQSIYLNHDYVDHGYGRLLLHAMAMELLERGYRFAFLWDIKENVRAAKFYEKNGFKQTHETRTLHLGRKELEQVKYTLNLESEFMIR